VSAALLPERSAVHLDAGYDSTTTRDPLDGTRTPGHNFQEGLPAAARRVAERTYSRHIRAAAPNCRSATNDTQVIDTLNALANAIITTARPIGTTGTTHRWETTRPSRRP
jgi:hypothetical protein